MYHINRSHVLATGLGLRHFSSSKLLLTDKEPFQRLLPNLNLATLGAHGHGKTTLASALSKASANLFPQREVEVKETKDIDSTKDEQKLGYSISPFHMQWFTKRFHCSLSDLPGHQQYLKNLLTHLSCIDVAILVVSTDEGAINDTKMHYKLIKHFGGKVLTFINHKEPPSSPKSAQENEELVTSDLSDFMDKDDIEKRVVVGGCKTIVSSAEDILNKIDATVPDPVRNLDGPLFWPIEQIGNIPTRGDFIAGRIAQGTLKSGDKNLEIAYQDLRTKFSCRSLEVFRKLTPELLAGDRGGAFIKTKIDVALKRGSVVYESGNSPPSGKTWKVRLNPESSELMKDFESINQCILFVGTQMDGKVSLEKSTASGDEGVMKCSHPIMAMENSPVVFRYKKEYLFGHLVSIV